MPDVAADYEQMWVDLRGFLEHTRDSGQRVKSVTALMKMDDMEATVIAHAAAAITQRQAKSGREFQRITHV